MIAWAAIVPPALGQGTIPRYSSTVLIYDLGSKVTKAVQHADVIWEAPNWSRDGQYLLANSGGQLYRVPIDGSSAPTPLALDPALGCNNDHDFSRDGRWLAISASSPASARSQIYLARSDGSSARLLVEAAPSYFHGWSPDGRHIAFVANRDGNQYDLYRISIDGGTEERLTTDAANDDGPDYSPDGRWIYFNSARGGGWNIWRMPAAGAAPGDTKAERVTNDDLEDWFPHPSPDGKWLLFLSFPQGTEGHDYRDRHIQLRILPMPGRRVGGAPPRVVAEFTGGQGSINVNSWSPDSRRFAYVTYDPNP
ncbi:MAG TPA: hypothetical protein VE046_12100 [Steroidobacteraceae bacterium]|nr:hypothetical protein [Steroidobacteraceae bacterium]